MPVTMTEPCLQEKAMAAIDDEHSSPRKLPSIRRALLWLGIACTVPTILVASAAAYEDYLLRKERV